MKFKLVEGNKREGDRILLVKTDDFEMIKHKHIYFVLIMLLKNELKIYREAIEKTGRFFFREVIEEIISEIIDEERELNTMEEVQDFIDELLDKYENYDAECAIKTTVSITFK